MNLKNCLLDSTAFHCHLIEMLRRACRLGFNFLIPLVVFVYLVPRPAVAIGVALAKWDVSSCGAGLKGGLLATGVLWAAVLVTIVLAATAIVCHPKHARKRLKRSIADRIRLVGCIIIVWLAACLASWIVLLVALGNASSECDAVLRRAALGEVLSLPAFLVVVLPAAYMHSHAAFAYARDANNGGGLNGGSRGASALPRHAPRRGETRRRPAGGEGATNDELESFLAADSGAGAVGSLAADYPQVDTRIDVVGPTGEGDVDV